MGFLNGLGFIITKNRPNFLKLQVTFSGNGGIYWGYYLCLKIKIKCAAALYVVLKLNLNQKELIEIEYERTKVQHT